MPKIGFACHSSWCTNSLVRHTDLAVIAWLSARVCDADRCEYAGLKAWRHSLQRARHDGLGHTVVMMWSADERHEQKLCEPMDTV